MNHYYFAASLPMLSFEAPPRITLALFRQLCLEQLPARTCRVLAELLEPGSGASAHPFVPAWRQCDTILRNAVARLRAVRLNQDAGPHLREQKAIDMAAERAVQEAFGKATPLEREAALDRWRWRKLDELGGFNPFSDSALFAYALKLQIVERWAGMDVEAGRKTVDRMVGRPPGKDDNAVKLAA